VCVCVCVCVNEKLHLSFAFTQKITKYVTQNEKNDIEMIENDAMKQKGDWVILLNISFVLLETGERVCKLMIQLLW